MKIIKLDPGQNLDQSELQTLLNYNQEDQNHIEQIVAEILDDVKLRKDQSLIELSNKFDNSNFSSSNDLIATQEEYDQAENLLSSDQKRALKRAFDRIKDYHIKQMPNNIFYQDQIDCNLGNYWRPISSIGVYAPGGTAAYPSSVLMSAVPAIVAGVNKISLASPSVNGKLNPGILYAAKLCEIKNIYKIGGAQAIAALAFGSESITKVDKIVGPGNSYVALAKKRLFGEVGIDMIAGPTDLTIIAENSVIDPAWVAIDALSQLEHGSDSRVFIIVDNQEFANLISDQISQMIPKLLRSAIATKSLKNSAILLIPNLTDAFKVSNFIAPEHLEIITSNDDDLVKKIDNAGAIFTGKFSPEAIGDYIAGPSHTLPTMQSSRFSSGLSVYDFLKRISFISCSEDSFNELSTDASILANLEGLSAHKLSIDIRK